MAAFFGGFFPDKAVKKKKMYSNVFKNPSVQSNRSTGGRGRLDSAAVD